MLSPKIKRSVEKPSQSKMGIGGFRMSEEASRKVLATVNRMTGLSEEEKKALKEALAAASADLRGPPEEMADTAAASLLQQTILALGLLMQWTSERAKKASGETE